MQKICILFLIPFILYIGLLSVMPQMEPDEARYSLISSAMNQSGNYVTPHIKNVIYLEKPPLVCWVTAIFFKVFGENDFSARLFAALCTWGCILLAYFIGRHFRDQETGLYAAMLLDNFPLSFYHRPHEYIGHASCLFRMSFYLAGLSRVRETKQKTSSLFILSCLRSCLFNKRCYRLSLPIRYFDYLAYLGREVAANMEAVFAHRHINIYSGCLSLADSGAEGKFRFSVVFLCP